MALGGKTPAEMAGIDLNLGDNKWKGLIEKASKNGSHEPKKDNRKRKPRKLVLKKIEK